MIFSAKQAIEFFAVGYAKPLDRLSRLVNEGKLIRLKRDLYCDDLETPPQSMAPILLQPSYLSFEYALSAHSMIPEAVYSYTSATTGKGKSKDFVTVLGTYTYMDIPLKVYPYGIGFVSNGNFNYYLASPEKALLDRLYKVPGQVRKKDIESLLFDDLRLGLDDLVNLDHAFVMEIAPLYGSQTLLCFSNWLAKEKR